MMCGEAKGNLPGYRHHKAIRVALNNAILAKEARAVVVEAIG